MQVLTTAPSPLTSLSPQGTEEAHLATQLLEALLGAPLLPLVTKHAELLEPLWRAVATDGSLAQDDAPDADDDDEAAPPSTARALGAASARRGGGAGGRRGSAVPGVRGGRSARRGLLLGFLKVYGACETLPKLCGAAALYADCARLLGHADHKVQSAALECIARWSQPAVNKYKAQLLGLIGEKSFRETLALFPVDERQDDAMLPQHRPIVLPLLTRLLYARLTQRGGRGASKNAMAQRRATIFAFFCSYHPHELRPLVDLILAPMARVGATSSDSGDDDAQHDADALARGAALAAVPPGQQLGVLRSLHEALAQLGGALAPYLPELLATLRHLLLYATHCVCFASPIAGFAAGGDDDDGDGDDADDGEDGDGGAPTVAPTTAPTTAPNAEEGALLPPSAHLGASVRAVLTLVEAREARLWVIKAWSIVMQAFPSAPLAPTAALVFRCVRPMLERLHTHYTQSPSGLLSALVVMTQQRETLELLKLAEVPVLPCVYKCLAAVKVHPSVVEAVLSIVEALLDHATPPVPPVQEVLRSSGQVRITQGDAVMREAKAAEADEASGRRFKATITDADADADDDDDDAAPSAAMAVEAAERAATQYEEGIVQAKLAEEMLHAHIKELLGALNQRLRGKFGGQDAAKALQAAGGGRQATRELRLLTRLSGHIDEPEQVRSRSASEGV